MHRSSPEEKLAARPRRRDFRPSLQEPHAFREYREAGQVWIMALKALRSGWAYWTCASNKSDIEGELWPNTGNVETTAVGLPFLLP